MAYVEMLATAFNLASNAVMMYVLCSDTQRRVNPVVIALQVCANACWVTFSVLNQDGYLLTTSCTSMCMQCVSLGVLQREAPSYTRAKMNASDDQLPQVPLCKQ